MAAFALIKESSIFRVTSGGNTGVGSVDPAIGSFHVLNKASILFRITPSTNVYASKKVEKRFRPR